MMSSTSSLLSPPLPITANSLPSPHRRHLSQTTILRWGFTRGQDGSSSPVTSRAKGQAFRILANPIRTHQFKDSSILMYNADIFGLNVMKKVLLVLYDECKKNNGEAIALPGSVEYVQKLMEVFHDNNWKYYLGYQI